MTIKINEIEYKLKYTLRALFIYEQITGKQFEMLTITDEYLFLYCQLLANNPDFDLSFEQLISHCDDDMGIIFSFKEFLSDEYKKQSLFIKDRFDESDKKKH